MKKVFFNFCLLLVFHASLAAKLPGPIPKDFKNIYVSDEIELEKINKQDLLLKHKYLSKPFHIISDGVYVYLQYDGEIMGQFLNKFTYSIDPQKNKIDIIVSKKNGKVISKYYIEERDNQVHIAELVK